MTQDQDSQPSESESKPRAKSPPQGGDVFEKGWDQVDDSPPPRAQSAPPSPPSSASTPDNIEEPGGED
jgi:hypothetical protein